MKKTKYIIVTGGVLSGLGKGITAASIGFFLNENYNVVPVKLDGYLNTDTGTMNPIEHGEVFVLEDGFEVDMDFGHYERFLNKNMKKHQSISMGKIFKKVRQRERKGEYLGRTVQLVPHVTDLIQEELIKVEKREDADIVIIEVGGTIGDMENELIIEALRQLEKKVEEEDILFIHLTYIPIPTGVREQKTKPTQQSINLLNKKGVQSKIVVARCSEHLNDSTRDKIALFSNIDNSNIFSAPDLDSVYKLPQNFEEQKLIEKVCEHLNLKIPDKERLNHWNSILENKRTEEITILIAGKYLDLEDSYASIVESLNHCEFNLKTKINLKWLDTSDEINKENLKNCHGIIVPGGFGKRGVEGKIEIIKYARENKVPFLGICYGLQLAIVEFARNVCNIKGANSCEVDPITQEPLITLLDEQREVIRKGGTMRLGTFNSKLKKGTIKKLYEGLDMVSERHRHRYEVNPKYTKILEENGMVISGLSMDRDLVEFIELPKSTHPFFIATQAHPELKSRLERPAPLFYGLIKSSIEYSHFLERIVKSNGNPNPAIVNTNITNIS